MTSDRRFSRRAASFAIAAALFAITPGASADPTVADKETARALMEQGDKAFDAKDYAAALKAYKAADALVGLTTTGIWVAKAQAAQGQLLEARDTAITVSRIPKQGESQARAAARKEAEELADSLAARIPSLLVEIEGPAEAKLTLDGALVVAAVRGNPQKLNPGKHTVAVTLSGYRDARQDVTLKEKENASIRLKLERSVDAPANVTPPSAAPAPSTPRPANAEQPAIPAPRAEEPGARSPLVYIGFGLGVAGLGVGAVTGILALSKASTAKGFCTDSKCSPAAQAPIKASNTFANVSNVGFGVGIVGVGLGVVGLLISGGKTEPKPPAGRALELGPVVGFDSVGLRGSF